jgi:hypothetical protein
VPRHLGLKIASASGDGMIRIYEAKKMYSVSTTGPCVTMSYQRLGSNEKILKILEGQHKKQMRYMEIWAYRFDNTHIINSRFYHEMLQESK